jgi:hypothetical protein
LQARYGVEKLELTPVGDDGAGVHRNAARLNPFTLGSCVDVDSGSALPKGALL